MQEVLRAMPDGLPRPAAPATVQPCRRHVEKDKPRLVGHQAERRAGADAVDDLSLGGPGRSWGFAGWSRTGGMMRVACYGRSRGPSTGR